MLKIWIILVTLVLAGSIGVMSLQQAFAFGFVERQQIGDFQKLTAQLEKDVGTSILEFAVENHPNNYLEFRQLTGQFKTDVINAVLSNPPEPDRIFGLLNSYDDGVERIFLGGPDTIPELLQDYGRDVFEIFGLGPA